MFSLGDDAMQHDLNRGRGSAGAHQPGSGAVAAAAEAAAAAAAELRREMREWKRRVEAQLESVHSELAIVKNCIMQLYNVLLPGKFPTPTSSQPQQPQPPPAPPPPLPHSLALPVLPPQNLSCQQVLSSSSSPVLCRTHTVITWKNVRFHEYIPCTLPEFYVTALLIIYNVYEDYNLVPSNSLLTLTLTKGFCVQKCP